MTIQVKIGRDGTVVDTIISESLEKSCDEAAVNAITAGKRIPATKDERPIEVWVPVPVYFKLK